MNVPIHDARHVRAHYETLAASYDQKANQACKRAYDALIRHTLGDCERVLELGAGSSPSVGLLSADFSVACDLTWAMLAARHAAPEAPRVVGDGTCLPFATESFDAVFSINVLEHVPDPVACMAEIARVVAPGGLVLSVTPNGNVEWLLNWLERLHLKLPEGPHQFLMKGDLSALSEPYFEIVEHRSFLAFPAGPPALVAFIDRVGNPRRGRGLFQYALYRRL